MRVMTSDGEGRFFAPAFLTSRPRIMIGRRPGNTAILRNKAASLMYAFLMAARINFLEGLR